MTTLCLFSSNIRPQYEQDIVDVAAAPEGGIVRFRYETRYVDDRIRGLWAGNQLLGWGALVLYSIQQPKNYHPPAFVPVRQATVVRTAQEGSVYVVDFRVNGYAALRDPVCGQDTLGGIVSDFTDQLSDGLVGHPGKATEARYSAVEGPIPEGFIVEGDPAPTAFERLVTYLAGTVSFASHSFWRVSGLREVGKPDLLKADPEGRWRLHGNTTYELVIVHFQPGARSLGMSTATFSLSSDASLLEIVGDRQFEIASRYDAIPLRLRVPALTDVKETVLTIRPTNGTKGPRADMRFVVGPTNGKRLAGGALAGLAVVLATIPGMMGKSATIGDKIWFPIVAALLTFLLGWWALPVRRS